LKLIRLAPLLAALALAACQTPEVSPTIVPVPSTGYARGIDMATDSSDVVSQLQGRRWLDFVARYYRDPASRWPALSADEARMLSANNMRVVAVFESHSHRREYFSYAAGYADGMTAYREARAVGQPPNSAIYFAVDFNAYQPDLAGPVDQYFRGVNAGMIAAAAGRRPDYRVGVYGSGAVCDYLKRTHLAQYAWLSNSTAWAGYNDFTGWDIRQGMRAPGLSFDQDSNEARGDYGGFLVKTQLSAL